MTVGIVCEYNPFHLGHLAQIEKIRAQFGPEAAIVCAMSGNFVQRGAPAIFDKSLRAEAALRCGADLVVELPVTVCLSSAEGYAAGAVSILSRLCDTLCFGAETGDAASLMAAARALLSGDFPPLLRQKLDTGISFPAARQAALTELGLDGSLLASPNDILAVEYCKAILSQGSGLEIFPIRRPGSYHAQAPDPENPSAASIRQSILAGSDWLPYVPENAVSVLENAPVHTIESGERAILARLRTMSDLDFEALPYGSEGLWRKFMTLSRRENTLGSILIQLKSKRYPRTRLDRMVMCAFLGLTAEDLAAPIPYARILGFDTRGREILANTKKSGFFRNTGEEIPHPYQALETRCGSLYGLFAQDLPEPPGLEKDRRVLFLRA